MSKNAEESRTEEGPVVTKPRLACLVSWSLSANQSPILDSGTSYRPVNCISGWNSDLTRPEKSGRDKGKLSVKFASVAQRWQSFAKYRETGPKCESAVKYREFGERSTESSHRGEVDPPQSRDLQYLIHWESLRVCSTKVESFRRRPDAGAIRQCIHRVIICPQQWKQRYILERTTITTWSPTRTPIPKSSRRCSISRRNWSWTRSTRSITSPRLNGNVLPWWDYLCYMTKYSSCQKQRYVSIQTESGKDARTFRGHDKMERTTPICSGFQWIQRIIQNRRRTI